MATSHESPLAHERDYVMITQDPLSIEAATKEVQSDEAGAISTFIGTTRNNFDGKIVLRLEYECYKEMALKEMRKICAEVRKTWPVIGISIMHRIGLVPVGEASVIIAISSAHRRESLDAVSFAIDRLKETVPIWKKEVYKEGETWKANKEYLDRFNQSGSHKCSCHTNHHKPSTVSDDPHAS